MKHVCRASVGCAFISILLHTLGLGSAIVDGDCYAATRGWKCHIAGSDSFILNFESCK